MFCTTIAAHRLLDKTNPMTTIFLYEKQTFLTEPSDGFNTFRPTNNRFHSSTRKSLHVYRRHAANDLLILTARQPINGYFVPSIFRVVFMIRSSKYELFLYSSILLIDGTWNTYYHWVDLTIMVRASELEPHIRWSLLSKLGHTQSS